MGLKRGSAEIVRSQKMQAPKRTVHQNNRVKEKTSLMFERNAFSTNQNDLFLDLTNKPHVTVEVEYVEGQVNKRYACCKYCNYLPNLYEGMERDRNPFHKQVEEDEECENIVMVKENGVLLEASVYYSEDFVCQNCNSVILNDYYSVQDRAEEAILYEAEVCNSFLSKSHDKMTTHCVGKNDYSSYVDKPPVRQWISMNYDDINTTQDKFTVLTYNVLSERYANSKMYYYCPKWALKWNYRKWLILKEILTRKADIICLQEVEGEEFRNFFEPELRKKNYGAVFKAKQRIAACDGQQMSLYPVDGCAIFFTLSKFTLIEEKLINLSLKPRKKSRRKEDEDSQNSKDLYFLQKAQSLENIALALVLAIKTKKHSTKNICVANAHFLWNPELSHFKLLQSMILKQEIELLTSRYCNYDCSSRHSIPVILCADLNSLPESEPMQYFQSGLLSLLNNCKKLCQDEALLNTILRFYEENNHEHEVLLESSNPTHIFPFTNYTPTFSAVIDYILFTSNTLKVNKILAPINLLWFSYNNIHGLPNMSHPSDHILLMTEFCLL